MNLSMTLNERRIFVILACWLTGVFASSLEARTWTSRSGGYQLEADAVAFNDTTVILKKKSGDLVAVELAELSEVDRQYVQSKELDEQLGDSIARLQTWESKDGMKIRGRVLAYGRKDVAVARERGKVTIDGKPLDQIDPLHRRLVLRVMSELEGKSFSSERELTNWARTLGAQPKVYSLEGVLMELESGDQLAVPFFMFADSGLEVLKPGWDAWVKASDDADARRRESLMLQSEAMEYQRYEQEESRQRQQIEILKLNLLAAQTGLTSIWEVGLRPGPGVYGRQISVMVTARNSEIATQMALQQHPGYFVFGVRRASF